MSELPAAGAIVQHDFRPADGHTPAPKSLRLLQWNIERGYKLSGIIEELKRLDADIVALQEVDVGCDRSGGVDTGQCEQWGRLIVFCKHICGTHCCMYSVQA